MPTPATTSCSLEHFTGCVQAKFLKLQSQTSTYPLQGTKEGVEEPVLFVQGPAAFLQHRAEEPR